MVHRIIEDNRAAILALCKKYQLRLLDVFGSAATGQFQLGRSDVDLLVEFEPRTPVEYSEAYFDLKEDLEHLLGTPVDLVVYSAIRNPYFRRNVDGTRRPIYAA